MGSVVAAIPYIMHYGVPLAAYGIVHLAHLFTHKKYTGPSLGSIVKG